MARQARRCTTVSGSLTPGHPARRGCRETADSTLPCRSAGRCADRPRRQLFVDDFLIEETTLTRTFHRPSTSRQPGAVAVDTPGKSTTSTQSGPRRVRIRRQCHSATACSTILRSPLQDVVHGRLPRRTPATRRPRRHRLDTPGARCGRRHQHRHEGQSRFVDGLARSRGARSGTPLQDGAMVTTTTWNCSARPMESTGDRWVAPA